MDDAIAVVLFALYLIAGYVTYRRLFPAGLFGGRDGTERDRLRRVGRRRVLPLPEDDGGDG